MASDYSDSGDDRRRSKRKSSRYSRLRDTIYLLHAQNLNHVRVAGLTLELIISVEVGRAGVCVEQYRVP